MAPKRFGHSRLFSLRVVGIYAVLSFLWIPITDAIAERVADTPAELAFLQTLKGWAYLTASSLVLYFLVRAVSRTSREAVEAAVEREAEWSRILEQMPAILWTTDRDLVITATRGAGLSVLSSSQDQAVGTTVGEDLGIDDPTAPPIAAHQKALDGQQSRYVFDFQGRSLDATVTPLCSGDGEVVGCLGFAVDVTEMKMMERDMEATVDELERANEQRSHLLRHLMRAETEERDRIASGIHDDSIQVMTSASMALDLLISQSQDQPTLEIARGARQLVGDAIRRLRNLVFELKPVELDQAGLATTLRLVLERLSLEAGFTYEIKDRLRGELPTPLRYLLYRILREAITNTGTHSRASKVVVGLEERDAGVLAYVTDDGVGLQGSVATDADHHFGLSDMQHRAAAAGGWCHVSTDGTHGTKVEVWVPFARDHLQPRAS